jgi:hypothetical protein
MNQQAGTKRTRFHFLHWVVVLWISLHSAAIASSLDDLFARGSALWTLTPKAFMQAYQGDGFRWTAASHEAAKAYGGTQTFLGAKVWETTVEFSEEHPTLFSMVLYNRGDAGELTKDDFKQALVDIQKRINAWTKSQPREVKDTLKTMGVKQKAKAWRYGPYRVVLTWSYSTKNKTGEFEFRSEFIRVDIAPAQKASARARRRLNRSSSDNKTVSTSELTSSIQRNPNGDVFISDIPMVNQGEKGYCAVATTERIMRHFGLDVDQHEMAQLASSSASEGTDPAAMISVLKRVGVKLGCKIKVLEEFKVKDFIKLVNRYNKLAKKQKLPEIELERMIVISDVYRQMDTGLLKRARMKSQSDYKHFLEDIHTYISKGTPLGWSVIVGKVTETPQIQSIGGHMRLIIGYNARNGDVIYSDSWGKGHEFKKMKNEDAWAITTGLYAIEPRWTKR